MLLPLRPCCIISLICEMLQWMTQDALNMTKLPQHTLQKIKSHVSLTYDETRENGLLEKCLTPLWRS